MIKQDIRIYIIYVAYSRPNTWTDLAEIYVDTNGSNDYMEFEKKSIFFYIKFHGQRRALKLVLYI